MRRSLLLLPLLLLACARQRGASDNSFTLCIENATAGYGNVVARVEAARYEVRPGRTECRQISVAAPSPRLTAATTGGGVAGPLRFTTTLPSAGAGCWLWRVSGTQVEGALLPCREGEGT